MRAVRPRNYLLKSLDNLWTLFIDNLVTIGAFVIIGLAALVVHKSVERLRLWGVPSVLIEGMEVLDLCAWVTDALAVLWLCVFLTFKFCKRVLGDQ